MCNCIMYNSSPSDGVHVPFFFFFKDAFLAFDPFFSVFVESCGTPGKARSYNKKMYLREEIYLAVSMNIFLAQVNLYHDKPCSLMKRMGFCGVQCTQLSRSVSLVLYLSVSLPL